MTSTRKIIIGIDAGTSVIKAVAFDPSGRQIATASVRNRYTTGDDGSATQSLDRTWLDCASALRGLGEKVPDLASRTAAIAVTGQGDGTWLVGRGNRPVADAWLWLDARAAPTVTALAGGTQNRARFEATGTGLNTCQQGAQLAHMDRFTPDLLDRAEVALHCKDWLYLNLTGVRATDPSEASFTFGNFRTRQYDAVVIDTLGLDHRRRLLPEIIDGSEISHKLTPEAAEACGLLAGTPVCLGYVDMLEPRGKGIVLWTLRYGDEVRDAEIYFEKVDDQPADSEMMPLVQQLIKKQTQHWSPKMVSDPVQDKLLDIIDAKKKQMKKPSRTTSKSKEKQEPAPSNVINIMIRFVCVVQNSQNYTFPFVGFNNLQRQRKGLV